MGAYIETCKIVRRQGAARGPVVITNLVIWAVIFDSNLGHGLGDGLERLDNVAEDDWLEIKSFALVEALSIDKLHLLQNCRFSRLSSTYR